MNILSGKVSIQNWRKDKEFPKQSKTDLTRNVKGTSLNRKEKAITRNTKIVTENTSLVKANIW